MTVDHSSDLLTIEYSFFTNVAGGEHFRTKLKGEDVPDYAKVQGYVRISFPSTSFRFSPLILPAYLNCFRMLLGIIAAFTIIVTFLGPENHSSHFEEHVLAFEGGGQDDGNVRHHDIQEERKLSPVEIYEKHVQDAKQTDIV